MNVPKLWMQFLYLISFFGQIYMNIDSKEYFCGKKLVKTLTELCSIYNNPTFTRNRFRRQIVQECCRSQCSRRHLAQYYCSEAKSSLISILETNPEGASRTNSDKDIAHYQSDYIGTPVTEERNSLTVGRNEKNANKNYASIPKANHSASLSSSRNKINRGKRNCKCRKRRAKRVKKSRQLRQPPKNIIRKPAPPPKIGHVEHSQNPFYIWKFSRTF